MLKGKRVLVTGASGFIGRHLCRRLVEEGADLVSVYHEALPEFGERVHTDLESIDAFWGSWRPEIVFHYAGVTSGAGVVKSNPFALVNNNLIIAARALGAAHAAGAKTFIFPSSTTGYPPLAHAMKEDEYFGDLFDGYRTIGIVKRFIEQLAATYPMTTVALRYSNVFGPGDQFDPVRSHVIQATIRKVAERQNPLVVWGDGEEIRDAIYVADAVESAIRAAEFAETNPGTHEAFNIGRGKGHSIKEILGILMMISGHEPEVVFDVTKPTLLKTRLVDVSKARAFLDWEAKVDMHDALRQTFNWFEENRK